MELSFYYKVAQPACKGTTLSNAESFDSFLVGFAAYACTYPQTRADRARGEMRTKKADAPASAFCAAITPRWRSIEVALDQHHRGSFVAAAAGQVAQRPSRSVSCRGVVPWAAMLPTSESLVLWAISSCMAWRSAPARAGELA